MNAILCRRPTPAEAEVLCAFAKHNIATSFPTFPADALEAYRKPWTQSVVLSRLTHRQDILLVATVDDEIIGLISGAAPEGGVGTIIWLFVDPRWRGRNAGRALYEAACGVYRELGAHKVKLTAPSEIAKRFYESCGMRVEGFHPHHWYNMDFYSLGAPLDCARDRLDHPQRIAVEHPASTEHEP